jgi:outer membrane protein assembly factor BamB
VLVVSLGGVAAADQWPQWRGPNLDGTSPTTGSLPVRWSETENVVWRTKLPSWSAATPIIWDDTIFVTSAQEGFQSPRNTGVVERLVSGIKSALYGSDQVLLLALDRKTGAERWRAVVGDGNHVEMKQNMASPSPVTDGRHVWVMTGQGTLTGLTFAGKQVWQRDIPKEYGAFGLNFGYGSSPLLHEGRLYLQVLHGMKTDDPSYLLAVDGLSGKTLWIVQRPTDSLHETPDSYSTPMLAKVDGKTQLIVSGGGYVTGHDLTTGREMWRGGGLDPDRASNSRTIASTLVVGDIALVPSRRRPFIAFGLDGKGQVPQRLWSTEYGPDVPTPTSDGERLYIVDDRGIALCLRVADGSVVWDRSRLEPKELTVEPGGSIRWEGDPMKAQIDLRAVYETQANPSVLLDNPINRSIPVNVEINLTGELEQPEPDFTFKFPNVSSTIKSELEYRLETKESRENQALYLLATGSFASEISLGQQAYGTIADRVNSLFNSLIASDNGKVQFGFNYEAGEQTPQYQTDDRLGLTLSTKISDRVLFNGKVGVPIGGVNETVIAGDAEIAILLNEDGTLTAKFFNRENNIRNFGEEIGYTQGAGISYNVEFDTFKEFLNIIFSGKNKKKKAAESVDANNKTTKEENFPDYINLKSKNEKKEQ